MKRLLIVLFLLASASCWPAVYYVGATGNDSNSGLDSDIAFLTLEKAAETVAAGDTVYVRSDKTYVLEDDSSGAVLEMVTAGGSSTPIRFIGYNSTTDTLDSTFACVTIDAGENSLASAIDEGALTSGYYEFSFFRLTGGSGNGFEGTNVDRVYFFGCRADNNGNDGFHYDRLSGTAYCMADNNANYGFFSDYWHRGYYACISANNGSVGIYNTTETTPYVGCLIYGNSGIGAYIRESMYVANTVEGNGTQDGFAINSAAAVMLFNNIFYNCNDGIDWVNANQLRIAGWNMFFSNTNDDDLTPGSPVTTWKNVYNYDPLFVDASNSDYRLRGFSPALTAGIDVAEIDAITSRSYSHIGALAPAWKPLIHADGGQTVTLNVTVVADASVTASSIRIVLDPNNEFGCYSASSYATVDATTVLSASGTVSGSTESLLIPWQLENTAETGVWSVSLAEVEVQ